MRRRGLNARSPPTCSRRSGARAAVVAVLLGRLAVRPGLLRPPLSARAPRRGCPRVRGGESLGPHQWRGEPCDAGPGRAMPSDGDGGRSGSSSQRWSRLWRRRPRPRPRIRRPSSTAHRSRTGASGRPVAPSRPPRGRRRAPGRTSAVLAWGRPERSRATRTALSPSMASTTRRSSAGRRLPWAGPRPSRGGSSGRPASRSCATTLRRRGG
jgi:hypothetical protein